MAPKSKAPASSTEISRTAPMVGGKNRFVLDISALAGSNVLSALLRLGRGLIVARLLTVEAYGVFGLFGLVLFYSKYAHLGVVDGATRELMFSAARNEPARMRQIRNAAFGLTSVLLAIVSVGLILWAIFVVHDTLLRFGLVMAALQAQLLRTYSFFEVEANVRRQFVLLGLINLIGALVGTALAIAGTYFFGVYGLIAAVVVTLGTQLFIFSRNIKLDLRLSFGGREALRLVRVGFPMMTSSIAYYLLRNADKTMVGIFLGVATLGLYSFAAFINEFLFNLLRNVTQVMTPHFFQAYARTGEVESLRRLYERALRAFSLLLPPVLGTTTIVLSYLVTAVLPHYAGSLLSLKILVWSTFFVALAGPADLVLLAVNRQTRDAIVWWLALALNVGLNYAFIRQGHGIGAIATSTLIAQAAACLVLHATVSRYYHPRLSKLGFYLFLYVPAAWAGGILWLIQGRFSSATPNLVTTAAQLGIFWAACIPLVVWAFRSADLLGVLRSRGAERGSSEVATPVFPATSGGELD